MQETQTTVSRIGSGRFFYSASLKVAMKRRILYRLTKYKIHLVLFLSFFDFLTIFGEISLDIYLHCFYNKPV